MGGWIVQQLLLRGEDPAAIRILDLRAPSRPEALKNNVDFISTDVSSAESVISAFTAPWPRSVAQLPLTVLHTVAFIGASDRHPLALGIYERVNLEGTRNVLAASQAAGCSIFISTSSGSISTTPPVYLPWVPRLTTKDYVQILPNAEPTRHTLSSPLESFGSCYAYSKARAEALVRSANDPKTSFRTGCIRPAHAIYGHGCDNLNNLSFDYLRRGWSPTWITDIVNHFVDARNVSAAHLWYEDAFLKQEQNNTDTVGGKAYAVTDPNPPVTYGHLYRLLTLLAHPSNPCDFPKIPPIPILLIAHVVEFYSLLRLRWGGLLGKYLPALKGDLAAMQPAIYNMCTAHFIYDDSMARREIGYRAVVGTLRGLCDSVVEFNGKVEERLKRDAGAAGKGVRDEEVVRREGLRRRREAVEKVAVKG